MAVDNLNYYSSGLPAGQQTDKYTSQPGCLKSKNLDIFSSSKSVKATAWSEPSAGAGDIIKQDGDLILKTDGKVYDISSGSEVLVIDPSINFPVYQVSYNGEDGTYSNAQWGTVQDLVAKYEGDEWKSFAVFTDRASFVYSKDKYTITKDFGTITGFSGGTMVFNFSDIYHGFRFEKSNNTDTTCKIELLIDGGAPFTTIPLWICADQDENTDTDISVQQIKLYEAVGYYYDGQIDGMVAKRQLQIVNPTVSGDIFAGMLIEIPTFPLVSSGYYMEISFKFTRKTGINTNGWQDSYLYIDMNGGPDGASHRIRMGNDYMVGDYNSYYTYLPIAERELVSIGEYGYSESYWMKGKTFQPLYKWTGSWEVQAHKEKKILYDFIQDMGWETDPAMDVIGITVRNEQIYMIGNMNGNGYIIPCDLSGGRGTPYIAYGCTFKGATNIDYLLYLVGEDRGISTLWVFNQQELVPLLGGNKESGTDDLVDPDEQYNFDGKIVNYRKNLILTTSDGRIFRYGQTYGGKGGTFIHDLKPSEHDSLTIDSVKAYGNDLIINYTVVDTIEGTPVTTHWAIIYQDDIAEMNYNTEWSATYPIVLGNHLLEKEESDLYASYILPSADTSLEFWGMANHYHFWTFTSEDDATLDPAESYKIAGATGDYALKFVERNENQYTFRLEGDLPLQTTNEMKITDSEDTVVINYSDFNHFRKIGEITTDKYCEGEFRFHNLNNQLELPKSHSLQIMVKGKGTANYTPELFALDLVANQRDRG